MKKILSCIMATFMALSISVPVMAAENISVFVNNKKVSFDVPPQTINGRTMVPMRATFEALGAKVEYVAELDAILAAKGNIVLAMFPNKNIIGIFDAKTYEEKETITTDVAPVVINGRTLVPIRVISDCFGYNVKWDNQTKTINITSSNITYKTANDDLVSPEQFAKNTDLKNAYAKLACDIIRKELKYPNTATFSGLTVEKLEEKTHSTLSDSLKQQFGYVPDDLIELLEETGMNDVEPYSIVKVDGYVTAQNGLGIMKQSPFYVTFNLKNRTIDYIMLDGDPIWHFGTVNGKTSVAYPSYSLKGYYY